jgi:DNA-directed RNA polymerase specialized sigma24 family protein
MERGEVKAVLSYYAEIPGMLKLLRQEQDELNLEYNSIRAIAADDTGVHGNTPGRPTEQIAIRMIENGTSNRLKEIEVHIQVIKRDAELVRDCLDGLNGKYKKQLLLRYVSGYSWVKLSVKMGVPESTVRNWDRKAVEKLGQELEYMPMAEELVHRASRAR